MPPTEEPAAPAPWYRVAIEAFKANNIRLVTYVPDNVLRPLIEAVHADPFFTAFATTREEEAVGIVSGAWMGGTRGILLMQTSGFATLPNVIASLAVPFQIPVLMMVSERGTLGEFNHRPGAGGAHHAPGAGLRWRWSTTRMTRLDEVEFILDRAIRQAVATQAPACFILSPLLTGGKVFAK